MDSHLIMNPLHCHNSFINAELAFEHSKQLQALACAQTEHSKVTSQVHLWKRSSRS
jgi:hypothetical protein